MDLQNKLYFLPCTNFQNVISWSRKWKTYYRKFTLLNFLVWYKIFESNRMEY